jgi:hypothetical protein
VQARISQELREPIEDAEPKVGYLQAKHIAFMDMDALYLDLQQFKKDRGWHNLELPREELSALLTRKDWYRLYIPPEELGFALFDRVQRWEEIARALLRKYCARQYVNAQSAWANDNMESTLLSPDDPNVIREYRILVEESAGEIANKLRELKTAIEQGKLEDVEFGEFHAIFFDRHLYRPLLYVNQGGVHVRPVALDNEGEMDFVLALRDHCEAGADFLDGKDLYLLRNQGRGRGVGFFEAGNFYPDFIMWLVVGEHQYVTFIDPKGILRLDGIEDRKIAFHKTVKTIEKRAGDPSLTLNSCILSVTKPDEYPHWLKPPVNPEDYNIFSQFEPGYIQRLFDAALVK